MVNRRSEFDVFISKVSKTKSCWLWFGYIQNAGYGLFSTYKKTYLAHRFSYEHFIGKIPGKMTIDHLCRIKTCVNPRHMQIVSRTENIQRAGLTGIAKKESEKIACPQGHLYKDYGIIKKNGFTQYGTQKYARRCTGCYPNKT